MKLNLIKHYINNCRIKLRNLLLKYKKLKIIYLCKNNAVVEISKAKSLPQWQNLQEELKSRWLKIKDIIEKNQYNELRSEVGQSINKEKLAMVNCLINLCNDIVNTIHEAVSLDALGKLRCEITEILLKMEENKSNEDLCQTLRKEVDVCVFGEQKEVLTYLINSYKNILDKISKPEFSFDFENLQQELENIQNEIESRFVEFKQDHRKYKRSQDNEMLYKKLHSEAYQYQTKEVIVDDLVKHCKNIKNDSEKI